MTNCTYFLWYHLGGTFGGWRKMDYMNFKCSKSTWLNWRRVPLCKALNFLRSSLAGVHRQKAMGPCSSFLLQRMEASWRHKLGLHFQRAFLKSSRRNKRRSGKNTFCVLNLLFWKEKIVLSSSETEKVDYLLNLIFLLLWLYSPERTLIISHHDLPKGPWSKC